MYELTKSEYEIVNLLWTHDRPLSRTEIINLSPNRTWKPNTLHRLLNSLIEKGIVSVDGIVRTGGKFGRCYTTELTQEEFIALQMQNGIANTKKPPNSFLKVFSSFINTKDKSINKETLNEMMRILEVKIEEIE